MEIGIRAYRNHNGRQYWKITPRPVDGDERAIIQNWRAYYEVNNEIIPSFFELMDNRINGMLNGVRGQNWEYLPFGGEEFDWPNEFIVYEIRNQGG